MCVFALPKPRRMMRMTERLHQDGKIAKRSGGQRAKTEAKMDKPCAVQRVVTSAEKTIVRTRTRVQHSSEDCPGYRKIAACLKKTWVLVEPMRFHVDARIKRSAEGRMTKLRRLRSRRRGGTKKQAAGGGQVFHLSREKMTCTNSLLK